MFRPVAMTKVSVLVHADCVDRLAVALGRAGFVHLIDAVTQSRTRLLAGVDRSTELQELEALNQRCTYLMESLSIAPAAGEERPPVPTDVAWRRETQTYLESLTDTYQSLDEAINRLIAESGTLLLQHERLESHPLKKIRLDDLRDLDFLYVQTGRLARPVAESIAQSLGERALILHEERRVGEEPVLVICSRKNRWAVDSELNKVGFKSDTPADAGAATVTEALEQSTSRLDEVRQALSKHRIDLFRLAAENRGRVQAVHRQLQAALAVGRAQQQFGRTATLYCICGWIPAHRRAELADVVREATGGSGVIDEVPAARDEFVREGREQVPTQFAPLAVLRPFQQLVAMFGAPRYDDIEPSIFVALSFVLMFGLMFGDVGQGLVIALGGLYLRHTRRPSLARFRDAGYLLLLCGASAVLFGFLYGSVFGYEDLFHGIWLSPLRDVMRLLKATVIVGIVCISIGIILNIINKIRAADYLNGIFDKFGVIGIVFYWGAIGLGVKAAVAGRISRGEVLLIVILPLAILFVREPLYNLITRRKRLLHEDIVTFLMQSAIEVMETVTVFLGSTVSFVRVGAFALSHAAVCLAIYALVDAIRGAPLGGFWAVLMIVFGNLFVILLEGMVVGIQGVRLQYYELFSKYFAGDGLSYQPFSLNPTDTQQKE
ncbi:MAG: V-type ATP synthase subunit I [Lentisphaerae bacterium ADurb.BinA184]|nr:MAG: V-type ATP synthase subunit I [Lentisphaerae bacterium ADurb.BinA184]